MLARIRAKRIPTVTDNRADAFPGVNHFYELAGRETMKK